MAQRAPSDARTKGSAKLAACSDVFSAAVQFMQPTGHSGGARNASAASITSYIIPVAAGRSVALMISAALMMNQEEAASDMAGRDDPSLTGYFTRGASSYGGVAAAEVDLVERARVQQSIFDHLLYSSCGGVAAAEVDLVERARC